MERGFFWPLSFFIFRGKKFARTGIFINFAIAMNRRSDSADRWHQFKATVQTVGISSRRHFGSLAQSVSST